MANTENKVGKRVLVIFAIPTIFTFLFFYQIKSITEIKLDLKETAGKPIVDLTRLFGEKQTKFEEFIKELNPFLEVPASFLRFKVYAKNEVAAKDGDTKIDTFLNTKVSGTDLASQDTSRIKTGDTRKILNTRIKEEVFFKLTTEASFEVKYSDPKRLVLDNNSSNYYFFIWPTWDSFFLIFIVMITLWHGFLVIVSNWLKFILLGSPFIKIWNKFKTQQLVPKPNHPASGMKPSKFTSLAVFVIFFGIALIEAFQKQNWLEAGLFLALGIISLWADTRKN